jgi:lipoate-protein ligase A
MLSCAAHNLALDGKQFRAMECGAGQESLRFWESPVPVMVLGRSGVIARDIDEEACVAAGIEILRRDSGGGAVLLGPGCLNYSLVLALDRHPELRDVRASYRRILGWVIAALAVPELEINGLSDLALTGKKVSGNAQRRGAKALLHHGTLLYGFDPRVLERYLKMPARQPDYRRSRGHSAFVGNLPLSASEIINRLSRERPVRP